MTLWHVQKLYRDNVPGYVVLPYNFRGNIKIENSYKATIPSVYKGPNGQNG